MKRLLVFLLLVSASGYSQKLVDSRQREIVFTSVNVVPMDTETILTDQTVIIKDGKVQAIGKNLKYSKNALVINAKDKYLIPGLAEMHAHVPPNDNLESHKEVLFLFAANGITTIRGMLGHPSHITLRSKINSGEVLGPRFYTTGPSFNGLSVKTAERGAEMVREQKAAGYDFLKLHPGLTKETFAAISSTANELKIPFAGHVSFGVGVWRAIDAGYSSIDHLDGFIEGLVEGVHKGNVSEQEAGLFGMYLVDKVDNQLIDLLMYGLKEKNIWVVPTQSLADRWFAANFTGDDFLKDPDSKYMSRQTVTQWIDSKKNLMADARYNAQKIEDFIKLRRKLILECQKNGIGLLLGCDAPQVFNVPGFSTHNELKYLVDAGLTPYQALRTGTVNVAAYLNLPDAGIIKPGAVADLILIDGNPLADVTNTKKVSGVVLRGQWLSKTEIEAGLKRLEK
ncbi:MAG: amidohydrolase family protein [Cyclobacteriaceae bacterium]|nr:amidohydrolase family protein [Cyclobacteriaceae bacterium]